MGSSSLPFGFNVIGFISANLGLGSAARTTVRLLMENDIPVSIVDVDAQFGRSGHDRTFDHLKRAPGDEAPFAVNLFHLNPPEFGALIKAAPSWISRPGSMKAIVPFWELPLVPRSWLPLLEKTDLILAPTKYIEHMMATQVRNVPVRHFPQTTFVPDNIIPNRAAFGLPEKKVLFVTSFEMFSDINRKNTWAVLEAFNRAFGSGETNAMLVIKVNNARALKGFEPVVDHLQSIAAQNRNIVIIEQTVSYRDVLTLYASCDCLVSLHRAEGLGLSPMEAMFLGKPVIATGWSGNMDFMTDQNSCLIPYNLINVTSNEQSGYNASYVGGETVWADPDIGCAASWMKRLAENPDLRVQIGIRAKNDICLRHEKCKKAEIVSSVKLIYENHLNSASYSYEKTRKKPANPKSMKILFLNRSNAFQLSGGDTIVMSRLKEQLIKNGHEVDIIGDTQLNTIGDYDMVHLFNLTLPHTTELFAKLAVRKNVPFVITTLQENFPQYYHKATAAYQWFYQRIKNNVQEKGLFETLSQAKPFSLTTSPFAALAANRLFACGKTEATLLESTFKGAKISIVPFGSSIKASDALPELFEEAFGIKHFILVVGRLEIRKNQLMLLHALEESDLPIIFADGGFTYQPDYTALCHEFKRKGKTIFTGRLSEDQMVSAYRAARIHCLTSWFELPGLVSLEAARYGCPVVASSWGALPDYLGESCFWCSPEDPQSIKKAVVTAYESGQRDSCKQAAEQFSWERFGDETIAQYNAVLSEHTQFSPQLVSLANQINTGMSAESFLNAITEKVEKKDLTGALSFYNEYRQAITDQPPELIQVDLLMKNMKERMKK